MDGGIKAAQEHTHIDSRANAGKKGSEIPLRK